MTMQMNRRNFMMGFGAAAAAVLAGCGANTATPAGSDSVTSDDGSAQKGVTSDAGYTLVEAGKLTLISNFYFPPFVSMDEKTGDFEGFDVDVAQGIAEKLGLELNILPSVQFDTIVPTIHQGGKADISLGAITITDDRLKSIDFSDPYLDSNQALVIKKDATATDVASLNVKDKKIAVQSGTTGETWAQENISNATTVPLDTIIDAMTGVSTGLYDACVTDLPVAAYMIAQSYSDLMIPDGVYEAKSNPKGGQIATGEQYGVVISKDNPKLTAAINEALDAMWKEGTMDDIQKSWFGEVICSQPARG